MWNTWVPLGIGLKCLTMCHGHRCWSRFPVDFLEHEGHDFLGDDNGNFESGVE